MNRIDVKSEPLTYEESAPHSFFRDSYAAEFLGDVSAQERLSRHTNEMRHELRDSGSGNFSGLVVPQYLTGLAAPFLRAGRNTMDVANSLPLPNDGLTVNVSRITTGSAVAAQDGDNGAVTEASPDDTLLTVNVRTYAGMVDVSRQALERGTGVDGLLASDLVSAYNSKVNADVINGDGTSGTHLGILNTAGIGDVDVDDASPTAYETFQKVVKAIGTVTENRYQQPDIVIMHPRRWAYISGGLDSSNRPLAGVTVATSQNIIALGNPGAYGVAAGEIAGVPVVVDAGIPTNLGAGSDEDRIVVANRADLVLMEQGNSPLMLRYESVGSGTLTTRMVVYGYSAHLRLAVTPAVSASFRARCLTQHSDRFSPVPVFDPFTGTGETLIYGALTMVDKYLQNLIDQGADPVLIAKLGGSPAPAASPEPEKPAKAAKKPAKATKKK